METDWKLLSAAFALVIALSTNLKAQTSATLALAATDQPFVMMQGRDFPSMAGNIQPELPPPSMTSLSSGDHPTPRGFAATDGSINYQLSDPAALVQAASADQPRPEAPVTSTLAPETNSQLPIYQLSPLDQRPARARYSASCGNQLTFCETARQSLFGDVYAPGKWRPLDFSDFFTDGWNEPWAAGPAGGEGLTPRHGWLSAIDGLFYRLWLDTFTYQNAIPLRNGLQVNGYSSTYSLFLPLNRRFEIQLDVPYVVANSTAAAPAMTGGSMPSASSVAHTTFGDLTITPRFLLQESKRVTQMFSLGIRTPTGQPITGNNQTILTPRYEFWANPTGAWVARGDFGVAAPINTNSQAALPTAGVGNLAIGRYFTRHDALIGDLVFYGATNLNVPLDKHGAIIGVGPGTRFHIGNNWFVLGFTNFVITSPQPYSYQTQAALMKVF